MKNPIIWYVIADGARARIVHRQEYASGYTTELELQSTEAHRPSRAIRSDRPGRVGESASPARHAIEPRHDPHEEAKRAFAQEVAAALDRIDGHFDQLVLVAPARILAELRAALSPPLREKLSGEVAKDLTKVPIGELGDHLPRLARLPD
jgi:protein required for attachment to host cells